MKQLLILSGKGGTGKTTVAGAFIRLASARAYADCDVDAPNLHLSIAQTVEAEREDYFGMPKAQINADQCTGCGQCKTNCRFDAILQDYGYTVDPFACEGCGVCATLCPAGAVSMHPAVAGEQMLYLSESVVFSTAQLKMGSGTSGKLVTEVKRRMITAAGKETQLAIIDGSPGIGCPVIASLSGVSQVLIVAEPSISGLSDMERITHTALLFHAPLCVCVNKATTNFELTGRIEQVCKEKGIPFVGNIPFDPEAIRLINEGLTIADADCPSGRAVREIFSETMRLLEQEPYRK
ncbi:MAG: ATP-binding protein [Eubacteriales bacterium]|jgi:MinD superfamily P-loop ATPase|nr:ATP-binding protein [Eubacteriales bacterium]